MLNRMFLVMVIVTLCIPLEVFSEECEDDSCGVEYLTPLCLGECGNVTFKPGIRIQGRYAYNTDDRNNDFFIRRFRLKGYGDAFGVAKYYTEFKLDEVGRYCKDPKAKLENAWLEFTLCQEIAYLRIGLYDVPFSRNALTSDSKLLFMDRSLIKVKLTDFGLADNTIGLLLHGRPFCGHLEYAIGIFDNEKFEKIGHDGEKHSEELMPAGRVVWHIFDPATPYDGYADYKGSYICKGHRLAIGVNAAYLGSAIDDDEKFDLYAWGGDIFYNRGRYTFQAEYDWYHAEDKGYGWYVQGGYLFYCPFELALRYQELHPEDDGRSRWTSIGLNYYIREHNLKVQSDYTFRRERGDESNSQAFQIQLQFDY